MEQRKEAGREPAKERGWRDKPVESEGDKDLKEGGLEGARKEQQKEGERTGR